MIERFSKQLLKIIIVGGYTEEGEIDPYQLTIIYKSGEVKETHVKKSKNRNLKLSPTSLHNDEELYPNSPHSKNRSSGQINEAQASFQIEMATGKFLKRRLLVTE